MNLQKMDFNQNNWEFINMNSPADLNAVYLGGKAVALKEYDRCKAGHCLVSKFFLEKNNLILEAVLEEMEDGAGFGIYSGAGAFEQYLYIAYSRQGVEARISNRTPNGDTFMFEGHKKFYVLAQQSIEIVLPIKTRIEIKKDNVTVSINDEKVLDFSIEKVIELKDYVRVLIKSVNESNLHYVVSSKWKDFKCSGFCNTYSVTGRVLFREDNVIKGVKNANVHVEGYSMFWTITDEKGHFLMRGLPKGNFTLIAGKESMAFSRKNINIYHDSTEVELFLEKENSYNISRMEYPRKSFRRNGNWMSLNGYWAFDFDKENRCEKEEWFKRENHIFSKSIQVPFSWASLKAFGEENLADSDTMHQSNTYFNYHGITGGIGVYSKTFKLPEYFSDETHKRLHIGAISGVSKVWLDGKYLGNTIDTYEDICFSLGRLSKKQEHTLTIKVIFPYDSKIICTGKQGFWFTENPGIWQSVWIEEVKDIFITDVLVDYDIDKEHTKANLRGTILYEFETIEREQGDVLQSIVDWGNNGHITVLTKETGFYKLDIEFSTINGSLTGKMMVNGNEIQTIFDTTINDDFTDHKIVYVPLDKGRNDIQITKTEQLDIFKDAYCMIKKVEFTLVDWNKVTKYDIYLGNQFIAEKNLNIEYDPTNGRFYSLFQEEIKNPKFWDFKKPYLYAVKTQLNNQNEVVDEVISHFGLRTVHTAFLSENDEVKKIFLNNKPLYVRGVLDQGYNPWGIYTYPYAHEKKKGSMSFDIDGAFACGYNVIRMHIKDNEPLWYDYCDETGMLVWDEHPLNFYAKSENPVWQGMYFRKLKQMAKKHWYHPSIIMFSTFNESWGIEGWHERSPWEDPVGINFIKNAVTIYKKEAPAILVLDNSGYGKTSKTDIVDYHCYPIGYEDSRTFWEKLMQYNYIGSTFNFYNKKNRGFMQNQEARELIQRNCQQPLHKLQYLGDEVYSGQPLIISEFVHNDGNEKWIRLFDKLSGYVRMNITSQENEDTSPFNALRQRRDFGYVDENMNGLSYEMINSEDNIMLDYPSLSKVNVGERIKVPVYVSSFTGETGNWQVEYYLVLIDDFGNYIKQPVGVAKKVDVVSYVPKKVDELEIDIAKEYKAGYLFGKLLRNGICINRDFIQFEISKEDIDLGKNVVTIPTYTFDREDFKGLSSTYEHCGRNLFWAMGEGKVDYSVKLSESFLEKLQSNNTLLSFVFEVSSCECIQGVKITDEVKVPSRITLYINDILVKTIEVEDAPFDTRAIFSRAASIKDRVFNFNEHQGYGYGYKYEAVLSEEVIASILKLKSIHIEWQVKGNGMVLYGHRMGRYGINPMFVLKGDV